MILSIANNISLILSKYYIKKFKSHYLRLFLSIVLLSFITDIVCTLYNKWTGLSNYWIINIYVVIDAILLVVFFQNILKIRWVVWSCSIGFLLLFSFSYLQWGIMEFWGTSLAVKSLVVMFMTILSLYFIFTNEENFFIDQNPSFWLFIGLLTYNAGALFTFLLSSDLLMLAGTWKLHNVANILKNILFAIGLWKARAVR